MYKLFQPFLYQNYNELQQHFNIHRQNNDADDDNNDDNNHVNDFINKIVLSNMENSDVFSLLEALGYTTDEIKHSELLEYLYGTGLENIIFVDLSCSLTDIGDKRTLRKVKRRLQKENKLGV
jgi:hypothetical protein